MSDAALLGELKGKLEMLVSSMSDASTSRREMHGKLEALGKDVHSMRTDIQELAQRVTAIEPTFQDYRKKQEQVRGAGALGRLLWRIGGWLLSAAVALAGLWAWLSNHITFRS